LCGEYRADSNELHSDGILTAIRLVRTDISLRMHLFSLWKSVDKDIFPRHPLDTVQHHGKAEKQIYRNINGTYPVT
jgi:hypothetical protein